MKNLPLKLRKRQNGQALLLILLVLSLVLTLVLSSVSKSVTDVEISKYEDNSIRAFDAAQAGIEKAMVGLVTLPTPVELVNKATYTVNSSEYRAQGTLLRYPIELYSGESAVFWLVDHTKNANGDWVITCPGGNCVNNGQYIPNQLAVCWGRSDAVNNTTETPAVYIEFYYSVASSATRNKFEYQSTSNIGDFSDIKIATASADPYIDGSGVNKPRGNFWVPTGAGFTDCSGVSDITFHTGFKSGGGGTENEKLWNDLSAASGSIPNYLLFLIKVTILYNTSTPHPVAVRVTGGGNFPAQGILTDSTGVSGDVTRRLVLNQGYPEVPNEFSHAIFVRKSLTKL